MRKYWFKKICLLVSVLFSLSITLTSCGNTAQTPSNKNQYGSQVNQAAEAEKELGINVARAETLYIAQSDGAEVNFNPLAEVSGFPVGGNQCLNLIYETLFRRNIQTDLIEPVLGMNLQRKGTNQFAVSLNKNRPLKWSDDHQVTVQDVVYSFMLFKRRSPYHEKSLLHAITHVNFAGDSEIYFSLKDSTILSQAQLLEALLTIPILPAHVWHHLEASHPTTETLRAYDNPMPIGSGRFSLAYANDEEIVLQKRHLTEDTNTGPKNVIMRRYRRHSLAKAALKSGHLDVWFNPPQDEVKIDDTLGELKSNQTAMVYLRLNSELAALADRNVRQIIAGSLSAEPAFAQTLYGENAIKGDATMLFGGPDYSEFHGFSMTEFLQELWPQGKNATKAFITANGGKTDNETGAITYKDTFIGPFKLGYNQDRAELKQIAETAVQVAKESGVILELEPLTETQLSNKKQSKDYQVMLDETVLDMNFVELGYRLFDWMGISFEANQRSANLSPLQEQMINTTKEFYEQNISSTVSVQEITSCILKEATIVPLGYGKKSFCYVSHQHWQEYGTPLELADLFTQTETIKPRP